MTLQDYQAVLQSRFLELSRDRQVSGSQRPVFALEHGLSEAEVGDLKGQLRAHIKQGGRPHQHALAWVVYASEFGYEYDGDEYWQSFEAETPGWGGQHLRYWLQSAFRRFTRDYCGVEPRGEWAEHFTIICWPITHAILPQDLQYHLARVLYAVRHLFTSELLRSPDDLGALVAVHSGDASSRFRNFAKDQPLVGRIAAALLTHGDETDAGLILPHTLNRIVNDLERHQAARGWLKQASVSAHSARLAGLAQPARHYTVSPADGTRAGGMASLGVEPTLLLRRTGARAWEVNLQIPSFSPLGLKFPEFQPLLSGSRCVIAGTTGRPLARGQLLRSGQGAKLVRWPRPGEVLVRFEQNSDSIGRILRTECLLRPGPVWLFKVGADGQAREVKAHTVRPEGTYVILSTEKLSPDLPATEPATAECEGIEALLLQMPRHVDEPLGCALRKLGLGVAKRIEFWPAGLVPRAWDGEGHVEWLSTDTMVIGVAADHELLGRDVYLQLDDRRETALTLSLVESPTFVRLPHLSNGLHTARVFLRDSAVGDEIEAGFLEIVVTPPSVWAGDLVDRGAFQVSLSRPNPSLEDFWEGRLQVEVQAPSDRVMHCTVSLLVRGQVRPIKQFQRDSIPLPLSRRGWHDLVLAPCRAGLEAYYDRASRAEIRLNAGPLGTLTTDCARQSAPLRWIYLPGHAPSLRLSDDTGVEGGVAVARYAHASPDQALHVELTPDALTCPTDPLGGLYVARNEKATTALVVPPHDQHRLADLLTPPGIPRERRGRNKLPELISSLALWSDARLTGSALVMHQRRQTLKGMVQAVFGALNGEAWFRAEVAYVSAGFSEEAIAALASAIGDGRYDGGLGRILMRESPELAQCSPARRASYLANLTSRQLNLLGDVTGHVDFALRLASGHRSWRRAHGNDADVHIEWLGKQPMVGRASRFLVLAVASLLEAHARLDSAAVYEGWDFGAGSDAR